MISSNNRTGIWINENGEVEKPDPYNLYRYVGNNPTNATDPTGLQALSVDEVMKKFNAFNEARRYFDSAKKNFKDGIQVKTFRPGTVSGNPDGYIAITLQNTKATIYLRDDLKVDKAVSVLLFETLRGYYDLEIRKLNEDAEAGKVSRTEYGLRNERQSFKVIEIHRQVTQRAIDKKIWAEGTNTFKNLYKTFDEYMKVADRPSDPSRPDETHTGEYRKQWDRLYKKAWEKRNKEKKQMSALLLGSFLVPLVIYGPQVEFDPGCAPDRVYMDWLP